MDPMVNVTGMIVWIGSLVVWTFSNFQAGVVGRARCWRGGKSIPDRKQPGVPPMSLAHFYHRNYAPESQRWFSPGPVNAVASWQGYLALAISGMVARIGKAQHPHFAAAYGKMSRLRKEASVCCKDDERVELLIGILTSGQMSADLAITSSQHPVSATLSLARTLWP